MTNKRICILIGLAALILGGCVEVGIPADGNKKWGTFWPIWDMYDDPGPEWQDSEYASPDNKPPEGSMPRGYRLTPHRGDIDTAAKNLENPVPLNEETLEYGERVYNGTCRTCHGSKGKGNGPVVGENKYPKPPNIARGRAAGWSDGRIFHIISNGKGRMWAYDNQLYPLERWAAIHYVRTLQRAVDPHPRDRKLSGE